MKPAHLRLLLALGLTATLALAWFAPVAEGQTAVAAGKNGRKATAERSKTLPATAATAAASPAQPTAPATLAPLTRAERPVPAAEVPDLFKGLSWYVPPPPPPPPPPAPPPKPTAPPLPFAFLGQYAEDNIRLLILSRGDRVMTVSVGDVIDNTWRVDSLSGEQLSFVYLPLTIKQTLSTGRTQ